MISHQRYRFSVSDWRQCGAACWARGQVCRPPVRSRPSGVVLSVKSESKAVPVFPLRRDADPTGESLHHPTDDDGGANYDRYAPLITCVAMTLIIVMMNWGG